MEILRIPTHYAMQISYMGESDKSYVLDTLMRLSIGKVFEVEKSLRGGIVLSIWTEAVQLENKANAKKGKSLKIDIAPMVQPMEQPKNNLVAPKSNQIKSNQIKSNQVKSSQISNSSKEESETSSELVIDNRKEEINQMQDIIKQTVLSYGLLYKSGKQERNRIQNILTSKEFGEICEKSNMTREKFVVEIIKLSMILDFRKGKIYNAESFYKHYAQVYNDGLNKKSNLESKKSVGVREV